MGIGEDGERGDEGASAKAEQADSHLSSSMVKELRDPFPRWKGIVNRARDESRMERTNHGHDWGGW